MCQNEFINWGQMNSLTSKHSQSDNERKNKSVEINGTVGKHDAHQQ